MTKITAGAKPVNIIVVTGSVLTVIKIPIISLIWYIIRSDMTRKLQNGLKKEDEKIIEFATNVV